MLAAERVFRLAGSDDPALQILLSRAGHTVVPVGTRGSFPGLRALARGSADGAAIHLRHRGGSYNAPFARALLRARRPHLIHLWRREQGLLVAPGNPCGVTTPADLAGLRVAKREVGTGTRVLLDQMLIAAGVAPDDVAGPELGSHLEIALGVASGITDVGLGVRAVANDLDLDFLSLVWECYDIALAGDSLGAARPLITALRDPAVQDRHAELPQPPGHRLPRPDPPAAAPTDDVRAEPGGGPQLQIKVQGQGEDPLARAVQLSAQLDGAHPMECAFPAHSRAATVE